MKAAGGVLIGLGAAHVLYCGVAVAYALVALGTLSACLGLAMMFLGRRLWRS